MTALAANFQAAVKTLMPDYMRRAIDAKKNPILRVFAPGFNDAAKVFWDQWETNFGLTPLRGLGGKPDVVQFTGWKRYFADPAYFGQTSLLEEGEVTAGVEPGTLGEPMDVGNRLGLYMIDTGTMVVNRMIKSAADLWAAGKIDITDTNGRRFQYQVDGYSNQIKVPGTNWVSSAASATPIQDALTWKAALQKGTDSRFGNGSKWIMNSNSLAYFFSIAQIISTYKLDYGGSVLGLKKYNEQIAGTGAEDGFVLPQIEICDDGYYPTAADALAKTNWTYFVPDRTILWEGTRPEGQQKAQWQLTRHAGLAEHGGKGGFDEVPVPAEAVDLSKGLYVRCHYQNKMPHGYELEAGFNGLPVMFFGSAFAVVSF